MPQKEGRKTMTHAFDGDDLFAPVSYGGGGGGRDPDGGGRQNRNRARDVATKAVCYSAGAASGLIAGAGTAVVTRNPYASFAAGATVGGMVSDICFDVLD